VCQKFYSLHTTTGEHNDLLRIISKTSKWRDPNVSDTLGYTGRKKSKSSIGSHGHVGGMRSGQTRKTPKNLSVHESEDPGCGERL
jgi:hypothetical protein